MLLWSLQMLDDPEEKRVTVYCLDMERNEVVQLWRQPASRTGVMLAPVPRSDASDTRKPAGGCTHGLTHSYLPQS